MFRNRYYKFSKEESAFVQHLLGRGHQYLPMEQIMQMIEYAR
jgi:hypothetical protein